MFTHQCDEDAEKDELNFRNAEMYEIENEDHINMALEAGEDNVEDFREGLGKLHSFYI